MKITLKNIKYAAFASEETHCFEATVYVNGKRFCHVSNDGHGGPDNFYPIKAGTQNEMWDRIKEIDTILGKEQIDVDGTGKYFVDNSLEIEIGERMNEWLLIREARKLLKKICYVDGDGNIYSMKAKYKPTTENIANIKNTTWWKDEYRVLNEMPIEEAARLL